MLSSLKKDLKKLKNPQCAKTYSRYFKTGKGEYGEGDIFLGLRRGEVIKVAKKYKNLPLADLQKMISNPIHEFRQTSLDILIFKYQK
jgi:hypothetical protein